MGPRFVLVVLVATAIACDKSPTSPSDPVTLRVQVIDDVTRQAITDPIYRLELKLDNTNYSYTQPVVNGAANFPSVAQGEYRLTTAALFGYLQVDIVNVKVEAPQFITLSLLPIDDLGVEEISVDGQGLIPVGGTMAIPVRGVMVRMRGKYQSPRSPWPARNLFSVLMPALNPETDGFGHEGGRTESAPVSPNEFEIAMPNWTPCSRIVDGRFVGCYTASDTLVLTMSTPFVSGFGGSPLIRKYQKWPLKFVLAPGCCLP